MGIVNRRIGYLSGLVLAGAVSPASLMADAPKLAPLRNLPYQPALGADAATAPNQYNYLGAATSPASGASGPADPSAVAALVASIDGSLAALPQGAREEDYEAAVAFALDQSGQPPEVVSAALAVLQSQTTSRLASRAVQNVQLARRRTSSFGTGALAGDGVSLTLGTDDSPAVILGGGSNYG